MKKWVRFIILRLLVTGLYITLIVITINGTLAIKELRSLVVILVVAFYILETLQLIVNNLKENKKNDVITAIDELYAWSLESGESPDSILKTVKVIENYVGVRK